MKPRLNKIKGRISTKYGTVSLTQEEKTINQLIDEIIQIRKDLAELREEVFKHLPD